MEFQTCSNAEDLSTFFESHSNLLLAYVDRNLGPAPRPRVEPEDILQEVAASALASLERFQAEGRNPLSPVVSDC